MQSTTDTLSTNFCMESAKHSQNLLAYLSSLHGRTESSDLTLKVGGGSYHVHRVVMCQSPVFASMLYGGDWKESNASEVVLNEVEKYELLFDDFTKYLYGKSVQFNWHNVEALVYYSDKYAVDSLLNECLDFFYECVKVSGNLMCALNGWKMVRGLLTHRQECLNMLQSLIFSNIELVMKDESLLSLLDEDDMTALLKEDFVVCRTEFTIYRLFEAWLLMRPSSEMRMRSLQSLSLLLRIPYMRLPELSYVEKSPKRLFADENSTEFKTATTMLKTMLCEGYKYHAVGKAEWSVEMATCPPRLYLNGNACMRYRLLKTDGLNTWSKMDDYFEVSSSMSKADEAKQKMGFCVTLMRKINIQSTAGSDKPRLSLLSLEIRADFAGLMPFKRGLLYILENRAGCILRRPLNKFDISETSLKSDIKLDDINFDDVILKNSTYQFEDEEGKRVYLGLDIFLTN